MTNQSATFLAESPYLSGLTYLNVNYGSIREEGMTILRQRFGKALG
jgi:hypothetical protein